MKKLLAFLCALTLLLSLHAAAFSENNSHQYSQGDYFVVNQTLTVTKSLASWTLVVPATQTLDSKTLTTTLDSVSIENVTGLNDDCKIQALMNSTQPLTQKNGSGTINYNVIIYKLFTEDEIEFEFGCADQPNSYYEIGLFNGNDYYAKKIQIAMNPNDWNNALPGTYESTLNYGSELIY